MVTSTTPNKVLSMKVLIVKTVDDALNANDDTPVRLDGQIVKQISKKDFYLKTQVEKKFKLKSAKSMEW